MQGFTDKALILGPDPGLCDGKSAMYMRRLTDTIDKIFNYCLYNSIDPYYLLTDEIMYKLNEHTTCGIKGKTKAIWTLGRGDMNFLSVHNDVFKSYQYRNSVNDYSNVIKDAMVKIPFDTKAGTDDERITDMVKREARVARAIIKDFNLVFNIQYRNHQQYKASTKPDDMRAVVFVDAKTFNATVELSGQTLSALDILEVPNANMPVHEWEVPKVL